MPALSQLLDRRWRELLPSTIVILEELEKEIDFSNSVPSKNLIFRAFECDPKDVSVVIFGQDPYPNDEHAMGLAFSVKREVEKLPPSLRNIFTELNNDIGGTPPQNGDLTYLSSQGVMLLNRGLTLDLKSRISHPLWHQFTDEVAQVVAQLGAVGVFWGNQAQELAQFFPENKRIVSVHPSPLSAYRGFFGSKPFSAVNKILLSENKKPIVWTKQ